VCDRLLLMGCLEQLHHFGGAEVSEVVSDIQQEFEAPISANLSSEDFITSEQGAAESLRQLQNMDERLAMLEDSVVSTLELVKQVVSLASAKRSAKDES
jgi:general secretion pathway protein A